MSHRKTLVIFFAAGVVVGLLGLILGLIGMAATLFAAVLPLVNLGRFAFAGLAIGVGGTWTALFALAAQNCAAPDKPCGATPVDLTPHIVVSVLVLLAGVVVAIVAVRRSREEVRQG